MTSFGAQETVNACERVRCEALAGLTQAVSLRAEAATRPVSALIEALAVSADTASNGGVGGFADGAMQTTHAALFRDLRAMQTDAQRIVQAERAENERVRQELVRGVAGKMLRAGLRTWSGKRVGNAWRIWVANTRAGQASTSTTAAATAADAEAKPVTEAPAPAAAAAGGLAPPSPQASDDGNQEDEGDVTKIDRHELEDKEALIRQLESRVNRLMREKHELEKSLSDAMETMDTITHEKQVLQREFNESHKKCREMGRQNATLGVQLRALKTQLGLPLSPMASPSPSGGAAATAGTGGQNSATKSASMAAQTLFPPTKKSSMGAGGGRASSAAMTMMAGVPPAGASAMVAPPATTPQLGTAPPPNTVSESPGSASSSDDEQEEPDENGADAVTE